MLRRLVEPKQYVSIAYTERLAEIGARPSIGTIGDSYDNALAESMNGLYKTELIRRRGPWRNAEHLEIDSPWNTYRVKGLPPTPIGTAQMESIQAAASPAETDYLFYVLVSPDGRHGFSTTYEEHKEKIAQA